MYSGINNIQKKLEEKRDIQQVPFLTYEQLQAVKMEGNIISHLKQIALYCSRVSCDKCYIRNFMECNGTMKETEVNGVKKIFKNPAMCASPVDWMYHVSFSEREKMKMKREV